MENLSEKEIETHIKNAIKKLGPEGDRLGEKSKDLISRVIKNFVDEIKKPK